MRNRFEVHKDLGVDVWQAVEAPGRKQRDSFDALLKEGLFFA